MMIAEGSALADRTGLPMGMAYLLERHPQTGWRSHTNFGQLADFWLHVHERLKAGGSAVVSTVNRLRDDPTSLEDFKRAFVPELNGFLQGLEHHHRIEDDVYFPKFRMLDQRMVAGFELLEADHVVIHERLVSMVGAARQLLSTLQAPGDTGRRAVGMFAAEAEATLAIVLRHLADEEDVVIPALLEHGERPLKA